ncbi:hypothetical protein ACH4U7_35445 [Streptomyces sp. NPDC020845]|uniref:hypothetical protein n=1 Tax=Streptomyces sp. NPDC020845 TaxID=3365096 RepID=UPI003795B690
MPSGSTAYDYRDTYLSAMLGSVTVDGSPSVKLATDGLTTAAVNIRVATVPSAGRDIFAEVRLVTTAGQCAADGE